MVTDGQGWGRWFGEPREMHFCNSVKIKLFDNQLRKNTGYKMTWFLRNVYYLAMVTVENGTMKFYFI